MHFLPDYHTPSPFQPDREVTLTLVVYITMHSDIDNYVHVHYGVYRFANPSSGCNSCFRLDHTLPEWQLVEYLFLSEHLIRSKPNGVGR